MTIKELSAKYKLSKDEFWQVRAGNWVIKHDAVEKIANTEGIEFERPDVYTDNDIIAMVGVASIMNEDKKTYRKVWSTGEASKENVKMAGQYLYAMAEKRLKDRLTLKLINAYEYGIYSDSEAEDFSKPKTNAKQLLYVKIKKASGQDSPDEQTILKTISDHAGVNLKNTKELTEEKCKSLIELWA